MSRARIGRALRWLAGPRLPLEGEFGFCPVCGDDSIAPLDWDLVAENRWVVKLRCGSCGVRRAREISEAEAERLEQAIERGARVIETAAERLDRELMAGWVEAFTAGLRGDLIDVADFTAARP